MSKASKPWKHQDCERAYVNFKKAWYGNVGSMAADPERISFGFYAKDGGGGTSGEMSVTWERLGNRSCPKLGVFDDAWDALSRFGDVIAAMALVDDQNITPDQFCAILDSCGFVDRTPTERRE